MGKMSITIKEFVRLLQSFENQDAQVLVSNDEELNILYSGFHVACLTEDKETYNQVVIYGLSGHEQEEEPLC